MLFAEARLRLGVAALHLKLRPFERVMRCKPERAFGGASPDIDRLVWAVAAARRRSWLRAKSRAVEALIANTYRGSSIPLIGASVRHFAACLELVRRVPVHLFKRRKDAAAFERTARALESHARTMLAGAAVPVCP